MKIKRVDSSVNFGDFFKAIYNKKTKTILGVIAIIAIFFVGAFSGLVLSGFFGTFEKPSGKIVKFVQALGIQGLSLKEVAEGVLAENIKIPFNYLSGLLSNPDKLYVDVAFKDYQKIQYKRQEALKKTVLISSDDDWVNAQVSDGKKQVKADIRLKGDRMDHWISDKFSLRIKIDGDETLYGMKSFSIQHPKTRNYLNEFIYQNALKREDVLSVRYKFVEVIINGNNKGVYALEEHFAKQLLEYNNRREGPIIRFDEGIWYLDIAKQVEYLGEKLKIPGYHYYPLSSIDNYQSRTSLEDEIKGKEFDVAKNLLESFRLGNLRTSEVFDVDKLAKYFAVTSILGGEHASLWYNIKFYYNPITSKLEPIGFDADIVQEFNLENKKLYFSGVINSTNITEFPRVFFQDKGFYEKYVKELERISKKEYLDKLFKDLDKEIKESINIIHKSYPYYHFDKSIFYENQKHMENMLSSIKMQ